MIPNVRSFKFGIIQTTFKFLFISLVLRIEIRTRVFSFAVCVKVELLNLLRTVLVMHAFFALHFDPNSYQTLFFGTLTLDVKKLYNCITLFWNSMK